MIERVLSDAIYKSLAQFPVVGLVGSRQTGKTTLARKIASVSPSVFLDLEKPSDLAKLAEPELYLAPHQNKLVILDEIQHKPNLFQVMRSLIDENRKPGRFLILGSASPELIKQSSESLAGRIRYHELDPFNISEVSQDRLKMLWLRGGYPLSFLAKSEEESLDWRQAFLQTYFERNLPGFGLRVPAIQIRRFLQMTAHFHGQVWNHSKIAGSLGVTAPTAKHYLDILGETFLIRQMNPYFPNTKKRLVKSPKIYLRDSGLLHALLSIEDYEALQGHPQLGASWEGFWIEQIIRQLPDSAEAFYFRTHAGAEMDLVIRLPRGKNIGVEIKYSLSPKLTKSFLEAFNELECQRAYIIYPGKEKYALAVNIFALPAESISEIG